MAVPECTAAQPSREADAAEPTPTRPCEAHKAIAWPTRRTFPMIRHPSKWLASALATGLLAACGGGSSPTASTTSTPSAAAVAVQVTPSLAAATPVTDQPVDGDRANRRASSKTNKVYIVQLEGSPVTAYDGGIKGLQAT